MLTLENQNVASVSVTTSLIFWTNCSLGVQQRPGQGHLIKSFVVTNSSCPNIRDIIKLNFPELNNGQKYSRIFPLPFDLEEAALKTSRMSLKKCVKFTRKENISDTTADNIVDNSWQFTICSAKLKSWADLPACCRLLIAAYFNVELGAWFKCAAVARQTYNKKWVTSDYKGWICAESH